MAPEVVRLEAMPSARTDLYSLAVLLFLILMNHHPLEGVKEAQIHCLDLAAMNRLYGTSPLFIFDPDDPSNRPLAGYQDNAIAFWSIYPQFMKDLFTQAFTAGLSDPLHGRVRESTWRSAMSRARDSIVYCTCGAENFYDPPDPAGGKSVRDCWRCGAAIPVPSRIIIGRRTVVLNHDSRLFAHHLSDDAPVSFTVPVAEVSRHPRDPNRWGLKNMTSKKWTTTGASGTIREVNPGQSVSLAAGVKIHFGAAEGEIRF
jgi:DNA-binding helix-hairpin-helix protein with protein kinase domain